MSTALQLTTAEQALGISLPHRRMEDWRWTDLRQRISKSYTPQKVTTEDKDVERLLASSPFAKIAKARVVFVNGVFDEARSNLAGVNITEHTSALSAKGELIDLARATKITGRTIEFRDTTDSLLEIIHVTTDASPRAVGLHTRIHVAEGASGSYIETFVGEGDYIVTAITEISLEKGARLDRLKVQKDSAKATHLSDVRYNLSSNAQLNDLTVQLGSALIRQNGTCTFHEENGNAKINGAYLLKGKQHCDTALNIRHMVPNCISRETFKCVMDDDARGIFQGKVYVAKHAQKTDGKQSSHALLLSETAEFDAKPELEIYADDVVCGHGATAGDLNEDHLFYLKSRGIPEAEAKSLLIAAFVGEVFDAVENEGIREVLVGVAAEWLQG